MLTHMDDLMRCVDPGDIAEVNGEPHIGERGLLKIMASTMFHGPKVGRENARIVTERILDAAKAKGYVKRDIFLSSFSAKELPSRRTRALADEVADLLGTGGVFEALKD